MIDKKEDISYITEEDGVETPIHVISEFEREENHKKFVIYTALADPKDEESAEYYVAEIVKNAEGEEELVEIESEDDMAYCQEIFDELIDELYSEDISDQEEDDEEDNEESSVN